MIIVICVLIIIAFVLANKIQRRERPAEFANLSESDLQTSNPQKEYLIINVTPPKNHEVAVTGWLLAGGAASAEIGKAAVLPRQGQINEETSVIITQPARLIISSGESPLGISFRENKCSGLLETFQKFTPPLNHACSDCKQNSSEYPEYNACVDKHKSETNFFSNTWRIYLASETELWRNNLEVIRLYDQQKKLIDTLRY